MALNDSLFVSDKIIEKQVKLADGSVHSLFFRELPAVEFRKFYNAERSEDENVQAGSMAKLIAASLCEPDGKPAITEKQALKLTAPAMNAIAIAVMEVNGLGADAKNA